MSHANKIAWLPECLLCMTQDGEEVNAIIEPEDFEREMVNKTGLQREIIRMRQRVVSQVDEAIYRMMRITA